MPCVAMVPGTRPERLEVQTMLRKRQEAIRILPPVVEPMSEADFEEVTDLLADLILEKIRRNRKSGLVAAKESHGGSEDLSGSHNR